MNRSNSEISTCLMPHLMGIGPLVDKGVFGKHTIFSISYATDEKSISSLLPEGLHVNKEPVIIFNYRHSEDVRFLGGGELNLIGVYIPVYYKGKVDYVEGVYTPVIWENNTMAIILGREVMGAPKLYGNITNPFYHNDVQRVLLSENGRQLIEMQISNMKKISESKFDEIKKQSLKKTFIGWKHIPKENGVDVEVSHATCYNLPEEIYEVQECEGSVTFFETSQSNNYWTNHIIETLKKIPLKKLISAHLIKSSGVHLINQGRALK